MKNSNRRQFLAGTLAVVGATALKVVAQPKQRPNVLVILADEMSIDALSATIGKRFVDTPNLDALRANSMYFSRAYVANPLCVPSRTAMFTGRFPVETGVQTNDKTPIDPVKFPCIATSFRDAGYRTGYFGKWHLLYPEKEAESRVHGFEHMASEVVDVDTAAHVNEFISQSSDKPFFAVASFLNPHNICEWARGNVLNQGAIGDPPSADKCPPLRANHGVMKDEPVILSKVREAYHNSPLFPVGDFDDAKWRQYEWAYYRLVERVDALIGTVLTHLTAHQKDQNTVVLFTADHGDCQGAHFFNQKTVLFEEAARVPFMLSYPPRIKPGSTGVLVNTGVDFLPTLFDFAGIKPTTPVRGLSLVPVATGRVKDLRRAFVVTSDHLIQGGPVDGVEYKPEGRMLRTERYKYTVYSEGANRESLVDLDHDPGEMNNLAHDPKYQKVLMDHRATLLQWGNGLDDKFPYL